MQTMKKILLSGNRADVQAVCDLAEEATRKNILRAGPAALKLPFAGALIAVGGPQPKPSLAALARRLRKPIGVIWMGADVAAIGRFYDAVARVRARRYVHAAFSSRIRERLASFGIDAIDVSTSGLGAFFDVVLTSQAQHKRRAVVSGSSQRVAAFIEDAAQRMPEWDYYAAISGSRAEAWDDALSLLTAKRWYRLGDRREGRLFRLVARFANKRRVRGSILT